LETVHYLRAIWRSWLLVVLSLLAGGAGGFLVAHNTTPLYRSAVRMIVSASATDTGTGTGTDDIATRALASARALAFSQIASTPPAVADSAAAAGYPGGTPTVTSTATAKDPFISISVVDTNGARAQAIATAYAQTLPTTVGRLEGHLAQPVRLTILSPASLPRRPFSPNIKRELALGIAVGLVLGIGIALLRETLNRTVRDSEELAQITGLTVLGTVPSDLPKKRLPAATDPRSARAEAYRQIRTTLLNASTSGPIRTVAVTSASLGEGKTSLSTNLASVFSRAGHQVALVDADLRRPRVDFYFDIKPTLGLTDVLSGTAALEDALTVLDGGRLAVLTSGPIPANPSEALGGVAMEAVLAQLAADYEFVFVDTPPVLPVTDALVLAPKVDGVVLVTRLGRTTRDRVKQALANIERVNATILGVVPNHAGKGKHSDYRYPYSYEAAHRGETPPSEIAPELFHGTLTAPARRAASGEQEDGSVDDFFQSGTGPAGGSARGSAGI
jgi:capsular exopolysaccharide synthesis family protein